jgi:hypothetical protein
MPSSENANVSDPKGYQLSSQSKYILQGRFVDPMTGEVILSAPPGYQMVRAPDGGGALLVPSGWQPGDNRNVIRIQPLGSKFGYSNGYYVVRNQSGAAISVYSGRQFPASAPQVHNPLGSVVPGISNIFGL